VLHTWYPYPGDEDRGSTYHYHELGKWKVADYRGRSQEHRDDKAVNYLSNRSSGAVQCVIRCAFHDFTVHQEEALLWERVEFLNVRNTTTKETPWPAIAR
jgi:hypothetical protein